MMIRKTEGAIAFVKAEGEESAKKEKDGAAEK
jgi:hypothetical protein